MNALVFNFTRGIGTSFPTAYSFTYQVYEIRIGGITLKHTA